MLIISSCSSKKRVPIPVTLRAERLRSRSLAGFTREWVARVEAANGHPRDEVYAGSGVNAARSAAELLSSRLHYVSAGMSVVGPDTRIPGYDLTISAGGAVPYPVAEGGASSSAWWAALNNAFDRHQPLANLVRRHDGLVLIALSDAYLAMVVPELLQLKDQQRSKLRIVAAKHSRLPSVLESQAIRYDQRLQHVGGASRGAMASFVQRALLHFSGLLATNPRVRSIDSQRRLVERVLATTTIGVRAAKTRCSDEQVRAWLVANDSENSWSRSALLTKFRADGWACEQSRFSALVAASRER